MTDTTLTRAGNAPVPHTTSRQVPLTKRLRRLVSSVAHAAAERVISPYRDVPPEYYRFPWF